MLQWQLRQANGQKAKGEKKTKTKWAMERKQNCECGKNIAWIITCQAFFFCTQFSTFCCCLCFCKLVVYSKKRSIKAKRRTNIRNIWWRHVFNVKMNRQQTVWTQTSVENARQAKPNKKNTRQPDSITIE